MKKVSLFIMTYKGLETLRTIVENEKEFLIKFVVIGKDAQTVNDYSAEIEELCKKAEVPYFFKEDTLPELPEYIVTVSWRWLIKNTASRVIVFHESLLPKYRGFAPLVNQLICGEKKVGVTAIFGEEEYDTGEVLGQESMSVEYPITIHQAIEQISNLYNILITKILQDIEDNGRITASTPQNESEATYSIWRDEEDYDIDWTKSSAFISRFINSVGFPYKGASAYLNGKKIRIRKTSVMEDRQIMIRDIGKVIYTSQNRPVVVCGEGLLRIDEAIDDETQQDIFPLSKFRSRFT